jgi:type IV secretory pathway TrbF-like protein
MRSSERANWAPQGGLDTRYKRARQEWDNRMGSAVIQAKNWRLATFTSLVLVGFAIGGMAYLGAQPKTVPHIVEVDKLGAPRYVGPVGQSGREYKPSEPSLRYHLRRFIDATRTLSSDPTVVKRNWLDAYTLVTSNAANQLNVYAESTQPIKRAQDGERVSVELVAMVQLSKDTWQADWREISWDRNGNQVGTTVWRGNFRLVVKLPETEERIAINPIGLYIDEFHWSRLQA